MKTLFTPSLDEFLKLAQQGNVIPVFAEFVGDCETPVSAFRKFNHCPYSFLFESTEKNDVFGRFSFVGFDPRLVIESYGREIRVVRNGIEERFSTTTDPLDEVRKLWRGTDSLRARSCQGSAAAPLVFSATKRSDF